MDSFQCQELLTRFAHFVFTRIAVGRSIDPTIAVVEKCKSVLKGPASISA